jgi:hypothetical protein
MIGEVTYHRKLVVGVGEGDFSKEGDICRKRKVTE